MVRIKKIFIFFALLYFACLGCMSEKNNDLNKKNFSLKKQVIESDSVTVFIDSVAQVDSVDSLIISQVIDIHYLKNNIASKELSTSTFESKNQYLWNPDSLENIYYGMYMLFSKNTINTQRDSIVHVADLLICSNKYPWRYDNTDELFIGIFTNNSDVIVLDSLKVGLDIDLFYQKLRKPIWKKSNIIVFQLDTYLYLCVKKDKQNKVSFIDITKYKQDVPMEIITKSFKKKLSLNNSL
ncbi:MAG: hypothetical protein JJT94_01885 [Bernardetiaceae bacterium]|nr:hypothetical protein [Bernardetiaceae bacterium]